MLAVLAALALAAAPVTATALESAPAAPSAAARARYDAAMDRLVRGEFSAAADAFADVAADPGAGELIPPARALADASAELARRGRLVLREPAVGVRPAVDRSGRAELVLFQTLYGIYTGIGIAVAADAGARVGAALAVGGGAVGLAASLLATAEGNITSARASAIDSAAVWGALNGSLVGAAVGADGRTSVALGVASGLAALAGVAVATGYGEVSTGDVALVNSGGLWGLAAGALSLTFLHDPSGRTVAALLVAGADAGLLAMALTVPWVEVSRGHVLLIDAGGALGTALGLAIPFIGGARDAAAYGAGGLAGMAVGLAVGAIAFRGWDERGGHRAEVPAPFVAPLAAGGFVAGLAGRF